MNHTNKEVIQAIKRIIGDCENFLAMCAGDKKPIEAYVVQLPNGDYLDLSMDLIRHDSSLKSTPCPLDCTAYHAFDLLYAHEYSDALFVRNSEHMTRTEAVTNHLEDSRELLKTIIQL